MLSLLAAMFLSSVITQVHGAPYGPGTFQQRNDVSNKSGITTTIRSANGTDVTSSFQTLIYMQDDAKAVGNSSLNDRQVSTARRINGCRSHSARFVQSHCAHSRGFEVSLLVYVVYCQERPSPQYNFAMGGSPYGSLFIPPITTEEGACQANEICVNDMPSNTRGGLVATCVDTNHFLRDPDPSESLRHASQGIQGGNTAEGSRHGPSDPALTVSDEAAIEEALNQVMRALGNKRASVIISGPNGTMPLGVESLEVDTGAASGGKVEQQTCKDCFGLRTQRAAPNANFLETKATLMAATAVTGLIWITIFSG